MVFLVPEFHIVSAFALMLILISFPIAGRIFRENPDEENGHAVYSSNFSRNLSILLFVWSLTWITSFSITDYELNNLYNLIVQYGQNQLTSLITEINYAAGYNYSVVSVIIRTYGGLLLLISFTILAIALLWAKRIMRQHYRLLALLTVPLVTVALAVVILYFVNLDFPPLRLLVYIEIICTLFAAVFHKCDLA